MTGASREAKKAYVYFCGSVIWDILVQFLMISLMTDARREARKAFLALSSDDKAAQHTGSDDVKGDLENVVELPMDNDHQSPHSTPVGRLPCWICMYLMRETSCL